MAKCPLTRGVPYERYPLVEVRLYEFKLEFPENQGWLCEVYGYFLEQQNKHRLTRQSGFYSTCEAVPNCLTLQKQTLSFSFVLAFQV